jgi:hypothetical protein
VQANRLHSEAAFFSNQLHEFADNDIEGVRAVMDQIDAKRAEWTQVRKTIEYFDRTGTLPEARPEHDILSPKESLPGVAEVKVELSRLAPNISKYKSKLELTPDHKKAEQWREDLAKMEALKFELNQKLVNLTYATT